VSGVGGEAGDAAGPAAAVNLVIPADDAERVRARASSGATLKLLTQRIRAARPDLPNSETRKLARAAAKAALRAPEKPVSILLPAPSSSDRPRSE
jgi:hypothetical protein